MYKKKRGTGMKKKLLIGMSTLVLLGLASCGQKAIEKPVTNSSYSSEAVIEESSSAVKKEANTDSKQVKIASIDEVVAIYEKQFPNTDITSIQLEKERSGFVYQIEGVDDDNEYELKINAETLDTVKDKTEKLDRDEQGGIKREADKLDLSGIISLDEATQLAEKKAGIGQAVEWDLDRELSTTYWEVTIQDGNKESQIKLDAKTGDVLQVELDN